MNMTYKAEAEKLIQEFYTILLDQEMPNDKCILLAKRCAARAAFKMASVADPNTFHANRGGLSDVEYWVLIHQEIENQII